MVGHLLRKREGDLARSRKNPKEDSLWYKDAVIYELHIKAFKDSDGDGVGDIRGLIEKLDYLKELGVTAIWLLPFYPSPFRDDGYDISDYYNIHRDYGTVQDFKEFLKQAHRRGLKVITELVLNHTSNKHPWFERARTAKKGSRWRDFYVWSSTPEKYSDARVIFNDFEASNWSWDSSAGSYYWHRFYSHQPDLNYDNPRVQKEMLKIIDFWLALGVDGLRLDAVPYLYEREGTNCENLPETHEFLKKLRTHIDRKFSNRMLLAEANQWTEDAIAYFGEGDECHMAFNFPLMPRIFMAMQMEDRFPVVDILESFSALPDACQWAMFLRNHDELTLEMVTDEERDYMYRVYANDPRAKINLGIRRRLAPLLSNNRRRIELVNVLLFSLPGTPVIYYGDEIGMGDNYYLGDRDGVRTPMQWGPDKNAGFSNTNPQKLYLPVIIDPEYHFESVNVENQSNNLSSFLWWMKRVISMRKKYKAFSRGDMCLVDTDNHHILSFIRRYGDEIILVVINLCRFSQSVTLHLNDYAGYTPKELFSRNDFPVIKKSPYFMTMGPHSHFWFRLYRARRDVPRKKKGIQPVLGDIRSTGDLLETSNIDIISEKLMPDHFMRSAWFGGKGKDIRNITIIENIPLKANDIKGAFFFMQVHYDEGLPEIYMVPVLFASGNKAKNIERNHPKSIIGFYRSRSGQGVIYDGVFDEDFHRYLTVFFPRKKRIKGRKGTLSFSRGKFFRKKLPAGSDLDNTQLLTYEQNNSSIIYDKKIIVKLFRKIDYGLNPDIEVSRMLTENARFGNTPAFLGAFEYEQKKGRGIYAASVHEYVPNEGDGWGFVVDSIGRYLSAAISDGDERSVGNRLERIIFDSEEVSDLVCLNEYTGTFFADMIRKLGARTAEMHEAFFYKKAGPAFKPESFSLLYQKSVYQSMKSLVKQNFANLSRNMRKFDKDTRKRCEDLIDMRMSILSVLRRITKGKVGAMKMRIHGDYHLDQVLYTGKDFYVIDFEGEPARTLSERRIKRSALRDVAGMIRSFHYAAHVGARKTTTVGLNGPGKADALLKTWFHYISSIFISSYLDTLGEAEFLPKELDDLRMLLESFILEKAVYELGFEVNNRPDWVNIPVSGIEFIMDGHTRK